MVFLPKELELLAKSQAIVEAILKEENLTLVGWREVPVVESCLGVQARENEPKILQLVVSSPNYQGDDLERILFL